jgi:hypothetical protein
MGGRNGWSNVLSSYFMQDVPTRRWDIFSGLTLKQLARIFTKTQLPTLELQRKVRHIVPSCRSILLYFYFSAFRSYLSHSDGPLPPNTTCLLSLLDSWLADSEPKGLLTGAPSQCSTCSPFQFNRVRFTQVQVFFSLPTRSDRPLHPTSDLSSGYKGLFLGTMRSEREANYSIPHGDEL